MIVEQIVVGRYAPYSPRSRFARVGVAGGASLPIAAGLACGSPFATAALVCGSAFPAADFGVAKVDVASGAEIARIAATTTGQLRVASLEVLIIVCGFSRSIKVGRSFQGGRPVNQSFKWLAEASANRHTTWCGRG